jgi:hypothetical protein
MITNFSLVVQTTVRHPIYSTPEKILRHFTKKKRSLGGSPAL